MTKQDKWLPVVFLIAGFGALWMAKEEVAKIAGPDSTPFVLVVGAAWVIFLAVFPVFRRRK